MAHPSVLGLRDLQEEEGASRWVLLMLAAHVFGKRARCHSPRALWINPSVSQRPFPVGAIFLSILQMRKLSSREGMVEPPVAHGSPPGCRGVSPASGDSAAGRLVEPGAVFSPVRVREC